MRIGAGLVLDMDVGALVPVGPVGVEIGGHGAILTGGGRAAKGKSSRYRGEAGSPFCPPSSTSTISGGIPIRIGRPE